MKAMLVRDIRTMETTPERFACEMGITVEEAQEVLRYANDAETPEDCIAILDRATMEDGTVIVAGNKNM